MIAVLMAWILTLEVALLTVGNIIYVLGFTITQIMEKVTE